VPNALVEEIAGFNIHRGLLAIGTRPAPRTVDSLVPASSAGVAPATTPAPCTLLCVEGVNNMDNIGQLFRVAAAFACAGVVLSPECHDPLYRKSLRVSCGHALRVPFARSEAWTADLARLRTAHGFALIGATGHGAPLDGRDAGAAPARTALLVGAEFAGLSPAALAACDRRVRIPMAPGVDSLNVAVAAAVLLDRFSRGTRI
jgi:tRNA G18 (ribose-2'-O)-methylase SpoU